MGLKTDRNEVVTDISFYMDEVAERGIIVVHDGSGSGSAMDQAEATVVVPTGTGGSPAGLLLNDVVQYDLTRQPLNWHRDEVQVGSKVRLGKLGFWVTNKIASGANPAPGLPAFFQADGELTENSGSLAVGTWLSGKDQDGYAKVDISII